MNVKKLIAAVAVFAAAGSAFAQQAEFTAPDAGFNPSRTRAEVRQDLARAQSQNLTVQHRHDGQDTVYAGTEKSRQAVKSEQSASSRQRRNASPVNSLYFG